MLAWDLKNHKNIFGGTVGIAVAIVIAQTSPPNGLTSQAMWALGVFAAAVIWWMAEVLPDYATALLMCATWAGTGAVPFNVAFAQFSSDTYWLLVGALGLGLAVTKSGLLNRVSLLIMDKFPATFKGQTMALLVAGNLIAPLIPSVTAKAAIAAPFARGISEKLGFERQSKGAAGIFAAMLIGFGVTGPAFLSASFMCYTIKGLMPIAVQEQLTWTTWFINALPWTIVLMVLSYFAIQFLYKPDTETKMDKLYIKQQIASLGPMARNEKIVTAVIFVCLAFWMTERLHGIMASIIALIAISILICFNIFDRLDFRSGLPWDAIIFIGCIINIASVFPALKIDKWIGTVAGPYLSPLVGDIWLYIIVAAVAMYLVRFALISMTATFTIFTVIVTPFAVKAGVNPFLTAFILLTSVNVFNTIYQNSTFLAAYYATGDMVKHTQLFKMSLVYMLINIIGLMACVPVWRYYHFLP